MLLKLLSLKKWWKTGLAVSMLMFASCEKQEAAPGEAGVREEVSFVQRDTFTEQEQKFIDAYNEVLATTEIPDNVQDAPSDPANSDFAIVILPEEVYGTPAFSFLPLKSRELNAGELVQLASAYGKTSPEIILQDYCSYKQGERLERGICENRQLTSQEYFEVYVDLFSQYMTEGRRPEDKLQQSVEKSDPLLFDTSYQEEGQEIRVWIYPRREMTQEQILWLIDWQYEEVLESFTPKDGQITSDEVEEKVKEVISSDITDAVSDKMYLYYVSYDNTPAPVDQWYAWIHMENGGHDYLVRLEAEDGGLIAWRSYPENYCTREGFRLRNTNSAAKSAVTEEQVSEVAEDYLIRHMDVEQKEVSILSFNEWGNAIFIVTAQVRGETCYVYVDGTNLSVNGMEMLKVKKGGG